MPDSKDSPPICNWILDPITSAIIYVLNEFNVNSMLKFSVLETELGQPAIMAKAVTLYHSGDPENIKLASKIILNAPDYEKWATELRTTDYALINAHSLVSIWGVLESCLENLVILILTNHVGALQSIVDCGVKIKQLDVTQIVPENELGPLYSKIESHCRVTHDIVKTYEAVLCVFGLTAACSEHTEALKRANALRNCILHQGGVIDARSVMQVPELKQWLNSKYVISSEEFMILHRAVASWLNSLLTSIVNSKYMRYLENDSN